jgi:hypothetical protein
MDIPEYYRKYQSDQSSEPPEKPDRPAQPPKPPAGKPPEKIFHANEFTIGMYDDWQDNTVYTLTGPVTDGIQHNIIVNIEKNIEVDSLQTYVDWQVRTLETQLKSCRILLKKETQLNNGLPAYRVVFSWYPSDELKIYQEQIHVISGATAYKLTASFTKKTRKILGPQVERMMLSFNPVKKNAGDL